MQPPFTALALTVDNLDGAAVAGALPRLLDLFEARQLRATFFVEGINADQSPDALREIVARGHELGLHGWRHEPWSELDPESEAELLGRGVDRFAALGLEAHGFRPPGGVQNPGTTKLLARLGFTWCSPADAWPGVQDGVAVLPFRWPLVDAYHLLDRFADKREAHGDDATALTPAAYGQRLSREIERHARRRELGCVILHPFLAADDAVLAADGAVLDVMRELEIDIGPGGEIAARLRKRRQ